MTHQKLPKAVSKDVSKDVSPSARDPVAIFRLCIELRYLIAIANGPVCGVVVLKYFTLIEHVN